jgi:hypothetical protein
MKIDSLDANLSIAVAFWHLKCDRNAESIMFLLPEFGVLGSDPLFDTETTFLVGSSEGGQDR